MSAPATSKPELGLPSDRDLCHAQAAQRFVRAGELDRIYISTWQEMGFLAVSAEENRDWEYLGYTSHGSWLKQAFPRSRSVVYAAQGAVKELKDIPPEKLAGIVHETAHVLKHVPERIRKADPVLIQDAQNMTTEEFTASVAKKYPELHIEIKVRKLLRFEESQLKVFNQACDLVRLFHPEISRVEDCVEILATEYLLSNQQAFENVRS